MAAPVLNEEQRLKLVPEMSSGTTPDGFTIRYLDPRDLTAHPANFRRHPDAQRAALGESLAEHGWLAAPIWNETTGHLLDGHARVELALSTEERLIPVRVLCVSEAQEKRILASFDRIGELRERDDEALAALLQELAAEGSLPAGWSEGDLEALLGEFEPGTEEEQGRLDHRQTVTCPECGHVFSKA